MQQRFVELEPRVTLSLVAPIKGHCTGAETITFIERNHDARLHLSSSGSDRSKPSLQERANRRHSTIFGQPDGRDARDPDAGETRPLVPARRYTLVNGWAAFV
jgi:hypothetical protein